MLFVSGIDNRTDEQKANDYIEQQKKEMQDMVEKRKKQNKELENQIKNKKLKKSNF